MALASTGPAPYAPPGAVIMVIEHCRARGFPTSAFAPDVLVKIGVSESLAPRTMSALHLLDLVDDDGRPTHGFEALRKAPEDEYKTRFAEALKVVYAGVFEFRDPTDPNLRDAFRDYKPHGQQDRMVTLFLGLCEYAQIIEAIPKSRSPRRREPTEFQRDVARRVVQGRGAVRDSARSSASTETDQPKSGVTEILFSEPVHRPQAAASHPMIEGLLRELPPIGHAWPAEKRATWLAAQEAVFNLLYRPASGDSRRSSAE